MLKCLRLINIKKKICFNFQVWIWFFSFQKKTLPKKRAIFFSFSCSFWEQLTTSMHSSRTRTARWLTVRGGVCIGGVCLGGSAQPWGVCIFGGLPNPGGSASRRVCNTSGGGGSASGGSAQTRGVCIWGGVCPTLGALHRGGLPNPSRSEQNGTPV